MTSGGGSRDHGSDRLFVALPVPDLVRDAAGEAVVAARAMSGALTWTRPEGWHVTLAFLGDVPVADVPAVRDAVATAVDGAGPIELRLGVAGRFGRHALWLEVDDEPAGAVAALGEAVQAALVAARLPLERRGVRPHLTLARGARGRGAGVDDRDVAAAAAATPAGIVWRAEAVELVRSVLGRGPARYVPVAAWPLTD